MRAINIFASVICILTLSGCATSSGPDFQSIAKPSPSQHDAVVYVYRAGEASQRPGDVHITVDGRDIAGLGQWEFSWCHLAPGMHTFRAEWGLMDKPLFEEGHFDPKTLKLNIEANRTYYVGYLIQEDGSPPTMLESSGLIGKALSKSHITSVELTSEAGNQAVGSLISCRFRQGSFDRK